MKYKSIFNSIPVNLPLKLQSLLSNLELYKIMELFYKTIALKNERQRHDCDGYKRHSNLKSGKMWNVENDERCQVPSVKITI